MAQHRKSSSHVGAPGSVSQSCSLFQLPAKSHPGRQQVIAQVLESLHPNGRPSLNSSLLTSAWPCPSCWEHLGKEPADTRSLSIPIFLCLFAFQINKKYFFKKDPLLSSFISNNYHLLSVEYGPGTVLSAFIWVVLLRRTPEVSTTSILPITDKDNRGKEKLNNLLRYPELNSYSNLGT